jgi:hypothetical protein
MIGINNLPNVIFEDGLMNEEVKSNHISGFSQFN